MTIQDEALAHSALVSGEETTLHSHATGGGLALQGTVVIDPPSIARVSTVNVDISGVSGLLTNHRIYVQCQSDLETGLVCIAAYCPVNGTLRLRITNQKFFVAVNGASRTWAYQAY